MEPTGGGGANPDSGLGAENAGFSTPPRPKNMYRRRIREGTITPSSKRMSKMARMREDAMCEEMHALLKAEMRTMKLEMEQEFHDKIHAKVVEELMGQMKDMYAMMKAELQGQIRAECDVQGSLTYAKWEEKLPMEIQSVRNEMQKDMHAQMLLWKREFDTCMLEKDRMITELKEELTTCKTILGSHTDRQGGDMAPQIQNEIKELKIQVEKEIKTFAEVAKQNKAEAEENAKWIEVVKKHKGMPDNKVEVMNATLEEEAKRRARTLHVRVTGWEEKGSPQEDAHALGTKIGASDVPIVNAWRVGKDATRPRALILKFADMERRRAFLSKRVALKGEKIYLDEDLTPAQVAHRKEHMPRVLEARKEGKWAVYRDGKVIITDRRPA